MSQAQATLIILDWDDTILCSTFLNKSKYTLYNRILNTDVLEAFRKLDQKITELFDKLLGYGIVEIITNSELEWVLQSANKFLPSVMKYIISEDPLIPIISANDNYSDIYPNFSVPKNTPIIEWNIVNWKLHSFKDRLFYHKTHRHISQIISIGDSLLERHALHQTVKEYPNILSKSIKLLEKPSLDQLIIQQQLIINMFPKIFTSNSSLDLQLYSCTSKPIDNIIRPIIDKIIDNVFEILNEKKIITIGNYFN